MTHKTFLFLAKTFNVKRIIPFKKKERQTERNFTYTMI